MPARHRLPSPVEAWWRRHRPEGLALTGAVLVGVVVTAGTVAGVALVRHGHPAGDGPPPASVGAADRPAQHSRAGQHRRAPQARETPAAQPAAGPTAPPPPRRSRPAAAPAAGTRQALASPAPSDETPADPGTPSPSASPSSSPTPSPSQSPSPSPSPSPSRRGFPLPLGSHD